VKEIAVPFPNTEFQANLSEIAALKPDAVFVFSPARAPAKFVKDYAERRFEGEGPALSGSGFLTEGVLVPRRRREGIKTTPPRCITRTLSTTPANKNSASRSRRPPVAMRTCTPSPATTP